MQSRSSRAGTVPAGSVFAGAALAVLTGCGAADATSTDDSVRLEAVLSIERFEDASAGDVPSASAIAQFVILPSYANVQDTLGAAGLRSQLPERMGCVDVAALEGLRYGRSEYGRSEYGRSEYGRSEYGRSGFALREPLELLEAGDVSIQAGEMLTRLALNSFPPSGSASGVIYTTPDQSAAPLPPDENYAIRATGSGSIPPLRIAGRAPSSLSDVTVGGVPLERANSIVSGQPLDITWAEGSAGDRVYVELADAEHNFACAFPDDDGSGTLPAQLTAQFDPRVDPRVDPRAEPGGSVVRLSVHRIREAVTPEVSLEEGRSDGATDLDFEALETRVRFDFEMTAALRVQ